MLNGFLKLPGVSKLIHPKSNYRRWLFDKYGRYNYVCFYNNFGESTRLQVMCSVHASYKLFQKSYRGDSSRVLAIKDGSITSIAILLAFIKADGAMPLSALRVCRCSLIPARWHGLVARLAVRMTRLAGKQADDDMARRFA